MNDVSPPADLSPAGLDILFRARSAALVGISADPAKLTGAPLRNIVKNGFPGTIYLVNPKYGEIAGVACYPSIAALPATPDVALIMVGARDVPEAIRALGRRGTRAAVVLSSGFEESEGGDALAQDLRAAAAEYGMAVIGPNCEGLWSVSNRLILTFGSAANRDQLHHAPIAIISQSGAVAGGVSRQLQDSGIGCAYVVSVGNETCVDALDVMSWTIEQPDVRVILLFIEGLKRGGRLIELAARAHAKGIRVVALKSGNSRLGSIAASSHTGKVASAYAIYRDLLRQAGVIQVDGIVELIEAAEILAHSPLPRRVKGPHGGVGVASIPGGTRALTVDLCERHAVPLATFAPETEAGLAALLPGFSYVKNPTDLTGQAVSKPELFDATLGIVADDPNCEALIIQLANRGPSDLRERKDEIAELGRSRALPIVVSLLGDVLPTPERRDLIRSGVIPARDPVDAVRYLDWLYAARRGGQARLGEGDEARAPSQDRDTRRWAGLVALLDDIGIASPKTVVVETQGDLAAAGRLAFPLVVKALPDQAEHKTELGLVELRIGSVPELEAAIARIRGRLGDDAAPLLVQETVSGSEAVISVVRDPDFGPVLAIGSGGVGVELWADIRYLAAPPTREEIRRVLGEMKLGILLGGFRGAPAADADALVEAAFRLGEYAAANAERIAEIEINPLFVRERGHGVVAADILVKQAG